MAKQNGASANRREEIIRAAIEVFAEIGYYKATTANVAKRAEISQPYVFRFFDTKEALLLAALETAWARIAGSFRKVADSVGAGSLEQELIEAYEEILAGHRPETLLHMQAQTIPDAPIREAMQKGLREVRGIVLDAFRKHGIPNPEERTMLFLARGMLCNIAMALGLPELMET